MARPVSMSQKARKLLDKTVQRLEKLLDEMDLPENNLQIKAKIELTAEIADAQQAIARTAKLLDGKDDAPEEPQTEEGVEKAVADLARATRDEELFPKRGPKAPDPLKPPEVGY